MAEGSVMGATLSPGLQIVPGYSLEKRLGRGGFGEVWRAIGPGRVPVAMKIIAADGASGHREFRSLDLLRGLRHPNLLPIQAYWLLDADGQELEEIDDDHPLDTIVIAMLLGEKNLRQRLAECRKTTGQAIPPRELLELMRDAAKGIDFLNKPIHSLGDRVVAIQHRDIKPENLMLVGGGLMVADFGLSGAMEASRVHTENAAMTCRYAAPELFEHTATSWTDQYALALTYAELRTGGLPFPVDSTPVQMIRIHTEGRHDFSRLSPGESAVLKRATAAVPEERYGCCLELVSALEEAVREAGLMDSALEIAMPETLPSLPSGLQRTRLVARDGTSPESQVVGSTPGRKSSLPPSPQSDLSDLPETTLSSPAAAAPSRLPRIVAGCTLAIAAAAGTWIATRPPAQPPAGPSLAESTPDASPPTPGASTETSSTPGPVDSLTQAREAAAQCVQERRFADTLTAIEPVFLQGAAEPADFALRATAHRALAEADVEHFTLAAADFSKAGDTPRQIAALKSLAAWHSDHDQTSEAVTVLRQAVQIDRSPDLLVDLAQALLDAEQFAAARADALAAIAELAGKQPDQLDAADPQLPATARLHFIAAQSCLELAAANDGDLETAAASAGFDQEADQLLAVAVDLAVRGRLPERADWKDEQTALASLPRRVARRERMMRREKISELTSALADDRQQAGRWLELAKLEELDGQPQKAATHYAVGYSLQAIERIAAGELDDAGTLIDSAAKHSPDHPQLLTARAKLAVARGRDDDAVAAFDAALSKTPADAADRWQLLADRAAAHLRMAARSATPRTAWQLAANDLQAAIQAWPQPLEPPASGSDVTDGHRSLARLHHDHGQTLASLAAADGATDPDRSQQAAAALRRAVQFDPEDASFALGAGSYLLSLARTPNADRAALLSDSARLLTTAAQLADDDPEPHFSLGECLLLQGKTAPARIEFDRAVAESANAGEDRRFQFLLSQSMAYLREPRDDRRALSAADLAVALRSRDAAAQLARGLALRNLKQSAEAIAAFDAVITLEPKHPAALLARSQLVIERETSTPAEIAQAARDIETALAAAATNELRAESHYVRSLASVKTHVSSATQPAVAEPALLKALQDLQQALRLAPENAVYRQSAGELTKYAAGFQWTDPARRTESAALVTDLNSRLQ